MHIPTDQIDETALTRDRTTRDPDALVELQLSIATAGLRTPIEVFATETGYGLISGFRRLAAVRALHATTGFKQWTTIEATLRAPQTTADALHAMVEENEIREDISPWERARICVEAMRDGHYETLDAAVGGLFPNASRQKRSRLRVMALAAEELDDYLAEPETLTANKLVRLGNALGNGWGELILTALEQYPTRSAEAQWKTLANVIAETEEETSTPRRPKRVARVKDAVVLRRERTKQGWVIHITGPEASGAKTTELLFGIERRLNF